MTNPADLLNGLTEAQAAGIRALGSPLRLAASESLFTLGSVADCVYLIERGRVALTLPMHVRGHEQELSIEERGPGETVGWSALIPPHRFTLSATALIETAVLALPRAALLAHFAACPDIGYVVTGNIAAIVGQRLQVFQAMWMREMQRMVKLNYA